MSSPITVECEIAFVRGPRGRQELRQASLTKPAGGAGGGSADARSKSPEVGRIPRVARLMALAIHFESLIRGGELRDYADIARLGHVTRARVTQIMSLLTLAPDIQEALLFLPKIEQGREQIQVRHLLPITYELNWKKQRVLWKSMLSDL